MNSNKFSLKSRLESFRFAFNGIWSLLKHEHNSRIHLLAAILVIIVGVVLKISLLEWSLLTVVIGMVFLAELLNTAIEALGDIFTPERDERIRKAKDYAAAAVLISAIISLMVGVLIFVPKILEILRNGY